MSLNAEQEHEIEALRQTGADAAPGS